MILSPNEELEISVVSEDGVKIRKFLIKVKKQGGLKVLERGI